MFHDIDFFPSAYQKIEPHIELSKNIEVEINLLMEDLIRIIDSTRTILYTSHST